MQLFLFQVTDGLYGIGAWSERVVLETIFIGYEDDKTFNFASWIAMSGSLGCNSSDYSHVQALKKDQNTDSYIGIFTNQISRIVIVVILWFIIIYSLRNNVCTNICITCNVINGNIISNKPTFVNIKSCRSKGRMWFHRQSNTCSSAWC